MGYRTGFGKDDLEEHKKTSSVSQVFRETSPSPSDLQNQCIVHDPPSLPAERDAKASEAVQKSEQSELLQSREVDEKETLQSEEELLRNAVLHFPLNDN